MIARTAPTLAQRHRARCRRCKLHAEGKAGPCGWLQDERDREAYMVARRFGHLYDYERRAAVIEQEEER